MVGVEFDTILMGLPAMELDSLDASISSPSQSLDASPQCIDSTGLETCPIYKLGTNGGPITVESSDPDQRTIVDKDLFEVFDMATNNCPPPPHTLEAHRSRGSSTPVDRYGLVRSSLQVCKLLFELNLELMADCAWLQSCGLKGDQAGAAFEPERPGEHSPVDRTLVRDSQLLDIIKSIHSINGQQHPLEHPLEHRR